MSGNFLGKLSGRERIGAIAAVIIISVMSMDRLILGPIIQKINILGEEIKRKENLLGGDLRIMGNEERVMREVQYYERYSLTALPEEDELAGLLSEIENLAKSSKVYLIDSSPSGTREEGLLKAYLIDVDCEGSMKEVVGFMHSVENSRKLIQIEGLRIRPKEKGSDIISCNMIIAKTVMPE